MKISEHIKQCDEVSVLTILFGIRFHRSEDPGFNQNVLDQAKAQAEANQKKKKKKGSSDEEKWK